MTNFEVIKELSVEEMADFLADVQGSNSVLSIEEMLEWLNSEAEDDEEKYPDYDDTDIEMGFNPYMGCYDFDC